MVPTVGEFLGIEDVVPGRHSCFFRSGFETSESRLISVDFVVSGGILFYNNWAEIFSAGSPAATSRALR